MLKMRVEPLRSNDELGREKGRTATEDADEL
jgi:hypothetical protein